MKVLGISCLYHDSAAALVSDGKLLAAALEERFSRKKHDPDFPARATEFCLNQAGIRGSQLDYAVFYEKPFLKFERLFQSVLEHAPATYGLFKDATMSFFGNKLWIRSTIAHQLNIPESKILFLPHHLSHAASAFLSSPFDQSAILTVDGVGEWSTASIGIGNSKEIKIIEELRFPASLGLLYSAFTAFLGFEVNEGEYKVMGLSGYGKPDLVHKVHKVIKVNKDGSIVPNLKYFSYHYHNKKTTSPEFEKLFGVSRKPKTPFDPKNPRDIYYANVAASIQTVTEEIVLKMATHARQITELDNLCLAGGVALNGLANYKLSRSGIFKKIYIQPASGDAGGALGAALYVDHYFGNQKRFVMNNVYYGKKYSNKGIKSFLSKNHLTIQPLNHEQLFDYIASQIASGKIIGWFQDRFEWGPRALGARSILADPRNPGMKQLVNEKIKFRDPFRPFAPSVLTEHAHKYFDIPPINKPIPSDDGIHDAVGFINSSTASGQFTTPLDFMLYVVKVKKEIRKKIPAVTHVDGTSRPQLVKRNISPKYYKLIEAFYRKTGVPMLLNTSFNLATEPIVNSPEDAYKTFKESGLDILVLGDYIIEKKL